MGITGFLFFQTELKPVRRVSADANLRSGAELVKMHVAHIA